MISNWKKIFGLHGLYTNCQRLKCWVQWFIMTNNAKKLTLWINDMAKWNKMDMARRTSWGWWDECDGTALQTQDSKFDPWRSEAEHATSRSRRFPRYWIITSERGRNILFLWTLNAKMERSPTFQAGRFNHKLYGEGPRARRVALREINVDTPVLSWTRRGRH